MADDQDTMISPGLEALLEKVDSKLTLVSLAAKRSRQLISYDLGLGEGGGSEVPPQVTSTARKSLSMAFEEIQADKIGYERFYRKSVPAKRRKHLLKQKQMRQLPRPRLRPCRTKSK